MSIFVRIVCLVGLYALFLRVFALLGLGAIAQFVLAIVSSVLITWGLSSLVARTKQKADRVSAPPALQLVGLPCQVCGDKITFAAEATACSACAVAFHRGCLDTSRSCPNCGAELAASV
jgi:hypothetical protein